MSLPFRSAAFAAALSAAFGAQAAYPEPQALPAPPPETPPTQAAAERPLCPLGATAEDLTHQSARVRGTLVWSGALLTSVDRRGPARKAGLRAGDVIIALNGAPVVGAQALEDALELLPGGASADLSVVREQVTMPRRVRLSDRVGVPAAQGAP